MGFRSLILTLAVFAVSGTHPAVAQHSVTGVVRAEEAVIVRSEVAGIVRSIEIEEGDAVTEGQVLVRLRSDLQEAGLRLAQARVERAESALVASEVSLGNAERTLERIRRASAAVTEQEAENVADEVERLRAMLKVQQAELAEAAVESDARQLELEETRILAPFDGSVTTIAVRRGNTVAPLDTPLLELVHLGRLYVELALPVAEITNINEGDSLQVIVEESVLGARGRVMGRVTYVNPTLDPSSRTFLVKVGFTDPERNIRPGMRAEVPLR